MIVACTIFLTIHGMMDARIVTGELIQKQGDYLVINVANAVSDIPGVEGDYSRVTIRAEMCSVKEYKPKVQSCDLHSSQFLAISELANKLMEQKPEPIVRTLD